jgi:hypothetical protein
MKTRKELDNQIAELKKTFGNSTLSMGSVGDLKEWFKDNFNKDIIKVGDKLTYNFDFLFHRVPKYRKKFNGDPIQPITITYLRCDIIFFTYDKHPEFGENYIMWDDGWMRWLYPTEVKQSVLWKAKEYLKEKNPNEYYIQVNLFDIDDKYVNYIKDIDFSNYE